MKKIIPLTAFCFAAIRATAQEEAFDPFKDRQFVFDAFNICAVLVVIYLVSNFILRIIKQSMDYKLKNRMLDKETAASLAEQLLRPQDATDKRNYWLQWFFVLAALGIGLTITHLSRPFGLHSLAIIALSIAAGIGGYYFFTRASQK